MYNSIALYNWDCKKNTTKYLEKDLMSLYQIIKKFSIFIYLKYKVQITKNLTISSLALYIFLSTYNKNNSNIPLINKK